MQKSSKHPNDELLASYSAGSLPLSQALCISTHLEHCPDCLRELRSLNRVGSELMQQLQPAPGSEDLKQRLFERLDNLSEAAPQNDVDNVRDASVPRCLRQFVKNGYRDLSWRPVSAHIQSVELCRDSNGAKVELLRIKPGGSAVTHTHMGDEYTVVLEGSFSDDDGLYGKGDFVLREKNEEHRPVATQDRECICLAVTEGPIQFTGFISRLLNPFIRRSYA
jgi:putative transcriptional regulator